MYKVRGSTQDANPWEACCSLVNSRCDVSHWEFPLGRNKCRIISVTGKDTCQPACYLTSKISTEITLLYDRVHLLSN